EPAPAKPASASGDLNQMGRPCNPTHLLADTRSDRIGPANHAISEDRAHRRAAKSMSVEAPPPSKRAALADPEAREFLRKADPVLARLIDARPDFRPRAWLDELPPLDAFGTLVFQVAGQQLSVSSTRAIIAHLRERFGGHFRRRPSCSRLIPRCFVKAAS